jgi:hypothetical protein
VTRTDPKWGHTYGDDRPAFVTPEGVELWMQRKGQRVRFYDADGVQHGPEHANVYPATVAAFAAGYRDPTGPEWLNDGCIAEVKRKSSLRRTT